MTEITNQNNLERNEKAFLSLAELRGVHTNLLKSYRSSRKIDGLIEEIFDFIKDAKKAGLILENEKERWACQSLLDYWASVLYRDGHEPPDTTLKEYDANLAPSLEDSLCPYLGLDAFQEKDAKYYYGREDLLDDCKRILAQNRLLSVLGPSGSGKSSFVYAKLIPHLKKLFFGEDTDGQCYLSLVPGSNPLKNLVQALGLEKIDGNIGLIELQVNKLYENKKYLAQLINTFLKIKKLVLVIDQFEELFTLCDDQNEIKAFIENIYFLVQQKESDYYVVLTLRSDFENRLIKFDNFSKIFKKSQVRLGSLDTNELRQAIRLPANEVGLKFEDGVIESLLEDVIGEPAALPLLQFTLLQLWKKRDRNRITWDAYKFFGGGRTALQRSADKLYEGLIPEDQITAKRILLRMVRLGDELEFTSKRILRKELFSSGEASDRIERVLDKLVRANLVRRRSGKSTDDDQLEVAHEALVRNWPQLQDWLEENREERKRRKLLTEKAKEWAHHEMDENLLLRGQLLEEAEKYEDLDVLENKFVLQSRKRIEREFALQRKGQEWRWRIAILILSLLSGLTFWSVKQTVELRELQNELENNNRELTSRNDELDVANQEISMLGQLSKAEANLVSNRKLDALLMVLGASSLRESTNEDAKKAFSDAIYRVVYDFSEVNRLEEHLGTVNDIAFSPSGEIIASAGSDGKVILWRLDGSLFQEEPLNHGSLEIITSVTFSSDQNLLASGDEKGNINIWKLVGNKYEKIVEMSGQSSIRSLSFKPNSRVLAAGDSRGSVTLWSIDENNKKALKNNPWTAHNSYVSRLEFSPQGDFIVTGGGDYVTKAWDLSGQQLANASFPKQKSPIRGLAISPDGNLVAASSNTTINVWNMQEKESKSFQGHRKPIRSVSFNSTGDRIVSTSDDGTIKIWNREGEVIQTLRGHLSEVLDADFSPDSKYIASSGGDGVIRLWRLDSFLKDVVSAHSDTVLALDFSSSGEYLASGGADNLIKIWQLNTENHSSIELFEKLPEQEGLIKEISFDPTANDYLVTAGVEFSGGSENPGIKFSRWRIDGNKLSESSFFASADIHEMSFTKDGNYIVSSLSWSDEKNSEIKIFSSSSLSGIVSHSLNTKDEIILAISNKNDTIYSMNKDNVLGALELKNTQNNVFLELIESYPLENDLEISMHSAVVSPSGRSIAFTDKSGAISLWNIQSDTFEKSWKAHSAEILNLGFHPEFDDQVLITAGADNQIKFWDITSDPPQVLRTIDTNTPVSQFSITLPKRGNGETRIATIDITEDNYLNQPNDHVIKIWDAKVFRSVDEAIEYACGEIKNYLVNNKEADQEIRELCGFELDN